MRVAYVIAATDMFYGYLPEAHNLPEVTSHLILKLDRVYVIAANVFLGFFPGEGLCSKTLPVDLFLKSNYSDHNF